MSRFNQAMNTELNCDCVKMLLEYTMLEKNIMEFNVPTATVRLSTKVKATRSIPAKKDAIVIPMSCPYHVSWHLMHFELPRDRL